MRLGLGLGLARSVAGGGSPAFSPASLFASGEQGFWFDPSDFSTMFQDTAGAVPVTAVGQSVARINDKSGRGNNATQATGINQPILRQDGSGYYYLEFDGTNDVLTFSASIYAAGATTLVVALRGAAQADKRFWAEGNTSDVDPIYAWQSSAGTPSALSVFIRDNVSASPVLTNNLLVGVFDDTNKVITLTDSSTVVSFYSNRGAAQTSSYTRTATTLNVAALGALVRATPAAWWNGRIYGIIGRGATSSAGLIADTESWLAGKIGVTLP